MHTFSWHLYKNGNLKNHLGTSLVAQWLQISSHYNCSFNGGSLFWHDRKVCWKPCFSEAISQNYLRGWLPGYRPHFGSNKLFSILFIDCLLIIFVDNSEELTHLLFPGTLPPQAPPVTVKPDFQAHPSPQIWTWGTTLHCMASFVPAPAPLSLTDALLERGVSLSIHLVALWFGFHSYFSIKMAFTKFPRTSSNQ